MTVRSYNQVVTTGGDLLLLFVIYVCLRFWQQVYVILIWVDLSCLFVFKSGFCTGETRCFVYILWCLVKISS